MEGHQKFLGEGGLKSQKYKTMTDCAKGLNVAKHAWSLNHTIDFDNAMIIDKGNHCTRNTMVWSHGTQPKQLRLTTIHARSRDRTQSF